MFIFLRRAFTLAEIMIVVVIIAILLAIALPNFFRSGQTSQRTVCIANLKKIDGAIDQWSIEEQIAPETVISQSDEEEIYNNYVKGGKPRCPAGGEYTTHSVGVRPQVTCSKEDEGHKLPD